MADNVPWMADNVPWMADNVPVCDYAPTSLTKTPKNTQKSQKCVKMATFSSKMRRNGDLFAHNASKWALFRPKCVEIVIFRQTCVNIVIFSSQMRQNCYFFVPNASKLQVFRPKCVKTVPFSSKMRQEELRGRV